MNVEWRLFLGAAGFFTLTATVYWFVSYEDAGTTMLTLAVFSVLMIGLWLLFQSRRIALRPEDRPDADPGEAAGPVGYFPSSSIWPLVIAGGFVATANGLVFGPAIALPGTILLFIGLIGLAAEASRKR